MAVLVILAIKVILIKPVCIFNNDFPSLPKSCYSLEGKIIQKEEQLSEKLREPLGQDQAVFCQLRILNYSHKRHCEHGFSQYK